MAVLCMLHMCSKPMDLLVLTIITLSVAIYQ